METTLIILKPDAVQRGFVGRIVTRFEEKGLQLVGLKLTTIAKTTAETHYAPHKERPFYPGLVRFMTSGPVVVVALKGIGAIAIARQPDGRDVRQQSRPRHDPRRLWREQRLQPHPRQRQP